MRRKKRTTQFQCSWYNRQLKTRNTFTFVAATTTAAAAERLIEKAEKKPTRGIADSLRKKTASFYACKPFVFFCCCCVCLLFQSMTKNCKRHFFSLRYSLLCRCICMPLNDTQAREKKTSTTSNRRFFIESIKYSSTVNVVYVHFFRTFFFSIHAL